MSEAATRIAASRAARAPLLIQYAPEDWYWFIGADTVNVHSSKRAMLVDAATDQDYLDWTWGGARGAPTLDSMATLEAMMAEQYPAGTLKTYNPDARYRKASGGVIVTSISPVPFMTDPVSRNTLGSTYDFVKATPGTTINWKLSDGTFIVLDEAQLASAVTAVATFVQDCFTCESTNQTAIDAATMTTIAQIDAAYEAISNVYP
jgi:hypothetical protein